MGEKEYKKKKKFKSYMLPYDFRNFSVNYERKGVNLSKGGCKYKFSNFRSFSVFFSSVFNVL